MSVTFDIREFDMSKIGDGKVIIFIGKRHTGKSMLVLDYLRYNQNIPMGTCVSPTDEYNQTFAKVIPDMFIHNEFTPELLDKFVKRQKVMAKRKNEDPAYKNVDNRAFLIFDDCLYDAKNWINDPNMRFIFMNGRHVGITFLLTMQYLLGIPPNLRANVDYIFICKETKITLKKKLFEYYAGMFPSYEMFCSVLDECTKDYGCLVIDNTTSSDKLEEQVFFYKADINNLKNFRLCDDMFWEAPTKTQLYQPDDDALEYKPNYNRYNSRRNKAQYAINRLKKSATPNNASKVVNYNPQMPVSNY
jgi:hypothetical protein